ncbi:hypothetical protein LXL04_031469 [Taraxacum kok-saghyz]
MTGHQRRQYGDGGRTTAAEEQRRRQGDAAEAERQAPVDDCGAEGRTWRRKGAAGDVFFLVLNGNLSDRRRREPEAVFFDWRGRFPAREGLVLRRLPASPPPSTRPSSDAQLLPPSSILCPASSSGLVLNSSLFSGGLLYSFSHQQKGARSVAAHNEVDLFS